MFIGILDYFGNWFDHEDATEERKAAARELLDRVNALLVEAEAHGVDLRINPRTKTYVSGEQYGGFRPQSCPQGASDSAHKVGMAVDIFDPANDLDNYVTDAILTAHDLYREAPASTDKWCHLSTRAPGSKKRTFQP